jgi:predicted ATPase
LISALGLENFKAIGKAISLDIKPITILIGPNGSGKSSVMESMSLISQSIQARGNPLQLHGDLVNFVSYESVFHRKQTSLPLRFVVTIQLNEEEDF